MSDETEVPEDVEKKGGKKPLLIGVFLALLGGGGGFYAVSSGLILGGGEEMAHAEEDGMDHEDTHDEAAADEYPADGDDSHGDDHSGDIEAAAYESAAGVIFVPLDAIVVSLPPGSPNSHLRFKASLEVRPGHEEHVTAIRPRVIDVLNGYLRAVEVSELQDHRAFPRLKAQMLRRVQIVAGDDAVQNLLIQEFILN